MPTARRARCRVLGRPWPQGLRSRLLAGAVGLAALAACATPGASDVHLAPLWTDVAVAGGGHEIEALGGAAVARWSADDERLTYWALRPLASWTRLGEERTFTWVLPPLGTRFRRAEETVTRVLPLWYDSTQ